MIGSGKEKAARNVQSHFEGDNPDQGHRVRNNPRSRAGQPQEAFDVVVVGGGISGLTAAYGLRDKNVLVLEKDALPGGAAKRKEWNGIKYTLGPTNVRMGYEVELGGKRFDFLTEFYDEVGVRWGRIREPTDGFFVQEKLVHDPLGEGVDELPYSSETRDQFRKAWDFIRSLLAGEDCPKIPIEANRPRTMELDRHSLGDLMEGFGPEVGRFLDILCRSIFGETAGRVSAFAALCYLRGEFSDQYGAPGGTAPLAERLVSTLRDRVRTGCIVGGIEQDGSAAYVTYLDGAFRPVTVSGKAVIYATSKHVAPYIFRDLPQEKVGAMRRMQFDAYFVANLRCDGTVYNESFAAYFDDALFTDLVVNNWMGEEISHGGKQVLSLFCPRGIHGRAELLSKPSSYWVPALLDGLEKYIPGSSEEVGDVEICRYGHHYAVPYPGFITGARQVVKEPYGRYFFAKDDTQGVPCVEGAIWSGMEAARLARKIF